VNRQAGAGSRWSGAITGAVVLAFLPFSPLLESLPRAVLGAIVISAVLQLVRLGDLVRFWGQSPTQAVVATGTFVATIALSPHVERGVMIGVGLAFFAHLYREWTVHFETEVEGGSLRLLPRGVIWFGSVAPLEQGLLDAFRGHDDVTELLIDLQGVGRLDYTGAAAMARVAEEADSAGLEVRFVAVPQQARRALGIHVGGRYGVPEVEGRFGRGGRLREDP
jgi:SulP family sulfate permease